MNTNTNTPLGLHILGGPGRQGRRHADGIAEANGVRLVSVGDVPGTENALRAMADRLGCRWGTDYAAALADPEVNAVVIAVPTALHASLARLALAAGKHVLIEKPIAVDPADARGLLDLAEKENLTIATGHSYRFRAPVKKALALVDEGRIGAVHAVHATIGHAQFLTGSPPAFLRRELSGGGALLDLGVHPTDLAHRLLGDFEWVSGYTSANRLIRADVEEEGGLTARTADGRVFTLVASWRRPRTHLGMTFEVLGDRGRLVIDLGDNTTVLVTSDGAGWREEKFSFTYPDGCWSEQLTAFAALTRGAPSPIATGADGYRALRTIGAAYESDRREGGRRPAA